jgi:hypothetical protein
MENVTAYKKKYRLMLPELPERARQLVVASDAKMLGRGAISFIQRASGISRVTIIKGIKEPEQGISLLGDRSRQPGGGRKAIRDADPTVLRDLDHLVLASRPQICHSPEIPGRVLSRR